MKDDVVSRQGAIKEVCKMLKDCFWADDEELDAVEVTIDSLPSAQTDLDRIYAELSKAYNVPGLPKEAIGIIGDLMVSLDEPPIQPTEEFQWCKDCKEYDKQRHCCPRWNRVIRQTVEELKEHQAKEIEKYRNYPERKTGRWVWTDGMYACDQCHEVLDEMSPFCPMCGASMTDKEGAQDGRDTFQERG